MSIFFDFDTVIEVIDTNPISDILFKVISLIIACTIIFLYKHNFNIHISWKFKQRHIYLILLGVILSPIVIFITCTIGGEYNIYWVNHSEIRVVYYILLMLIVSIYEEIIFRFIPLLCGNLFVNYLISSLLFIFLHTFNNEHTTDLVFLINLFLISLLFSYVTWITKNIIFSVCYHFFWNFLNGPVLGLPVSGINMDSWFEVSFSIFGHYNPKIGLESSIISTCIHIILLIFILFFFKKRNKKQII